MDEEQGRLPAIGVTHGSVSITHMYRFMFSITEDDPDLTIHELVWIHFSSNRLSCNNLIHMCFYVCEFRQRYGVSVLQRIGITSWASGSSVCVSNHTACCVVYHSHYYPISSF